MSDSFTLDQLVAMGLEPLSELTEAIRRVQRAEASVRDNREKLERSEKALCVAKESLDAAAVRVHGRRWSGE